VPVDRSFDARIVATPRGGRGGMADAADSKSVVRKDVEVQVLSPAPVMDPCRLATGGTTARRSRIIVPTLWAGAPELLCQTALRNPLF
jgi:hypothetical protein